MLRLKKLLENSPISLKEYAELLGMASKTLYNKLSGESEFTYSEYLALKRLFPDRNMDYYLSEGIQPGA